MEQTVHPRPEKESGLRLDSWKQIAAYLNRHLTTVRRWERCEGLPVHRHVHSSIGSIYAYSNELDAWLLTRRSSPALDESRPAAVVPTARPNSSLAAGLGVPEGSVRLLGREAEFKAIEKAWNRACRGRQELVLIAGELGAGKTRLVADFAASLSGDAHVLAGRCDQAPHLPFTPFVEILHGIQKSVPADVLRELLAEAEGSIELAHLLPQISRLIPPASAGVSATPEGHRFRMFGAFTWIVGAIARTRPVFLIVEDIQWADEGSMLLLRYLIRAARDTRLCIAITCRESELQQVRWSAELLVDLRREVSATRIELIGLADDQIRCFIDEWTAQRAPINLIRFVTETTQGNPLFMTEMLRHLSETGASTEIKALGTHPNLAALGLPESIRDAVGRRISRLSQACNTLLTVASVAGRDFSLGSVEEVVQLPENILLDALDEALAANVLQEVAVAPGRFSFTHELIREVTYSRQSAVRRLRLHRQLAESIERHADPDHLPLGELARHFGHVAGHGDADKAFTYAVLAGDHAMAALAMEEAAACYKMALDALQFLPMSTQNRRRRFDLHFRRGKSFCQAGHWAPAKEDLEMALKFAETPDEEKRAELHVALAEASFGELDVAGVRHYAGEAQRLADRAGRSDLWADALAWKASAQAADGDVAGAIQSDRCAVARAGGIRSFALARTPLMLYWAGRTEEAAEQACQAVKNARESSDPAFLLYALQHQGLSLTAAGEYDKAINIFDEACTFGGHCGALPLTARAMSMSVAPLLSLGDLDGARERALEARELAHRVNFEPPIVSAGIDLLIIDARLHDPGRSEALLRETQVAVDRAHGWHAWKWRLRLTQAQAELNLARQSWDEAIAASSQAIAQSRSYGRPKYEAWGLATRSQASRKLGWQRAAGDAGAAVKIARRIGDPALLLKCLSILLELDGNDELRGEAQRTVERICKTISQKGLRSRFLAGMPSHQLKSTFIGTGG
jgi:tetratricopeptide (TPR) repeat protein